MGAWGLLLSALGSAPVGITSLEAVEGAEDSLGTDTTPGIGERGATKASKEPDGSTLSDCLGTSVEAKVGIRLLI